jgi:hypothetical protein
MSSAFPSLSHTPRAFPLPTIAEDTLQYALHLPQETTESSATALALLITQYVESLLIQPWLWNKDGWELKVATRATKPSSLSSASGQGGRNGGGSSAASVVDQPRKLEGRMRVGDAVDDEWLVVWLLREVSQKWPELVIR